MSQKKPIKVVKNPVRTKIFWFLLLYSIFLKKVNKYEFPGKK